MTLCGKVKKIDPYGHRIVFTDGTVLPIESLFSIGGELFSEYGSIRHADGTDAIRGQNNCTRG